MKIELQEVDLRLPLVKINYEQIKEQLENILADYTGLVVTEDTLFACKDAQKELSRLRKDIDSFRKDKKKELSAPIKAMENQCKELIALVEKAEKPIKEGISHFDNIRRNAKREIAERIIKEVVQEVGLNEKYASLLDVDDKYTNLTAKEKDVRCDVEKRAFALLVEQEREESNKVDVFEVGLTIVSTAEKIRLLAGFLKENGIYYEKSYQRNTKKNLEGNYDGICG